MSSARLAFVAASPRERSGAARQTDALRRVRDAIHASPLSRRIAVIETLGATLPKLAKVVREARPEILHFAGSAASGEGGLLLEDDGGRSHPVSSSALAALFRAARYSPRLVLLNCGHSDGTAKALSRHALAAIGHVGELADDAAAAFGDSLYRGVLVGQPLRAAFAAAEIAPARLFLRSARSAGRYRVLEMRPERRERLSRPEIDQG